MGGQHGDTIEIFWDSYLLFLVVESAAAALVSYPFNTNFYRNWIGYEEPGYWVKTRVLPEKKWTSEKGEKNF